MTRAFPGWMVRNIEKEKPTGTKQPIFQSVLPATRRAARHDGRPTGRTATRSSTTWRGRRRRRCARSSTLLDDARAACGDGLVGIHSTALDRRRLPRRGSAQGGGAIVWSPFSNLWLYGGTTDVLAARAAGLRVCLGSDWTPSGTRNVLGELKVAATWNQESRSVARSSDADLVEMATANPGDTLAGPWGVQVGRLVDGALADVAVFADVARRPVAHRARGRPSATCGWSSSAGDRRTATDVAARAPPGPTDAEPITVAGVRARRS